MPAVASLVCGLVFGWGLLISGLLQPAKVMAFLDILGAWDASLAVVMAAALAVASLGFALARRRRRPLLGTQLSWRTRTAIDAPLVTGSALFGAGWGLAGLCPGPALGNLASLSPQVVVFVLAMTTGIALHDFWQRRGRGAPLAARGGQSAFHWY
jgi:uncharacterized membrane protein YedE/YeeE